MDVCGNCGAPLNLSDDDECRWCRAKVRVRRPRPRTGSGPAIRWRWNWRVAAVTAAAVALAAGLGVGISGFLGSRQSGPPAATTASPAGAGQDAPPESTALQALRQDFGPWRTLGGKATDAPALLLLEGGATAVSQKWTVPSSARWWAPDLGGNVASVTRSGEQAAITDADGVGYTVGLDQAFVLSGNPGTVLLISPDGTVESMSLAQATAVRRPLAR